jgi:2-amino-4-hydroxy-6-hydroxymethyldihydropteridine diphosphokinase
LETLHRIEAGFGRVRMQRWGQRTLDLDLLAFGNTVFPDVSVYSFWRDLPRDRQSLRAPDDLVLPHPRLQDRAFVLVPLRDVAPGWRHPVSGMSAAQMLDRLDPAEISEIRPVGAS